MSPRRIQWRRDRPNPKRARYVGRGRGEWGKWGNPFAVVASGDPHQPWAVVDRREPSPRQLARFRDRGHAFEYAVRLHARAFVTHRLAVTPEDARRELRGLDLGCWCREGALCHADTLLAAANR